MKKLGCVLILAILTVLAFAYNQIRVDQMQKQVAEIAGKLGLGIQGAAKPSGPDLMTSLAQAEKSARRAKQFLKQGKSSQAQAELDKVLRNLKRANTVSSSIVGDAAKFVGEAKERAVKVFQKAWKHISEEAKTK